MKTAVVFACLLVVAYTVSAQHEACTSDADCTADCPVHGGMTMTNVCHHGSCHCHSTHQCSMDSDCSCNTGFTATCTHGHCHCHHQHP
ncbi:serine protease inhibitor Cvsi-2-like [Argopecten irradians]|uniref:serine protease inhibitor Cvsi-2-like n=1 Tax=Argopecten irradians TaxID=31199 RepID=UPI00371834A3